MNIEQESLLKAGVQFGNLTQRWNPKMKSYIFKKNGKLHLLDKQKIVDCFFHVKPQIEKMTKEENTTILFVGTAPHLAEIVKQAAINCQSPYLVHHWLGGFLTNFRTIQRSIKYLKDLLIFQQSEKFAALSKREQAELEKKINKLKKVYEGVLNLPKNDWFNYVQGEKRPNVLLFIIGLKKEKTAIREAKKLGIPIMAICNTSADPSLVDYIIPGNDWKASSVDYLVNAVAEVIRESKLRKNAELVAQENESPEETNRV